MSMSADLRVALSLWLNAWEAALKADRARNDAERVRSLPSVIKAFADASYALAEIADDEVEPAPAKRSNTVEAAGCSVSNTNDRWERLLTALVEWDEATEEVCDARTPTPEMYQRADYAETVLKRFISAARRAAVLRGRSQPTSGDAESLDTTDEADSIGDTVEAADSIGDTVEAAEAPDFEVAA